MRNGTRIPPRQIQEIKNICCLIAQEEYPYKELFISLDKINKLAKDFIRNSNKPRGVMVND